MPSNAISNFNLANCNTIRSFSRILLKVAFLLGSSITQINSRPRPVITNLGILNNVGRYNGAPWFEMKWIKVPMLLRNVIESMGNVDEMVNTGHSGNHSMVSLIVKQ